MFDHYNKDTNEIPKDLNKQQCFINQNFEENQMVKYLKKYQNYHKNEKKYIKENLKKENSEN